MSSIKLYKGDCLDIMPNIPTGSVDVVICDPPYGTTACKWDSVIPFEPMWKQLNRVIKPNGAIVLFGSEPFSSALRMSNIDNYKYDWIWQKNRPTGSLNANIRPMINHELILVFYREQPIYNKILENRDCNEKSKKRFEYRMIGFSGSNTMGHANTVKNKYNPLLRNPTTVKKFNSVINAKRLHPTQKPVLLMEYLMKTYTNEGDTVLDFTMGSGTTGVAAKNLNRDFIGIEKDENYLNIAEKRINDFVPQFKLFE